jgi:hypothetical protein
MEPKETVEIALRVLKAWTCGEQVRADDVEVLRQHALPHEFDLPVDDLACIIVKRACSTVIQESQQERKDANSAMEGGKRRQRLRKTG